MTVEAEARAESVRMHFTIDGGVLSPSSSCTTQPSLGHLSSVVIGLNLISSLALHVYYEIECSYATFD